MLFFHKEYGTNLKIGSDRQSMLSKAKAKDKKNLEGM
jgi:hypothetical protein